MASNIPPSLQEVVDKLVHCSVCMEMFDDPRFLPCGHTFCLKCIKPVSEKPNVTTCPLCRRSCGSGINLGVNFEVKHILDYLVNESGEQPDHCEMCCAKDNAAFICIQCKKRMCDQCLEKHKAHSSLRCHTVISEDEECTSPVVKCVDHEEVLTHFCTDCRALVCVGCMLGDCNTHSCQKVENTIKNVRAKASEFIFPTEPAEDILRKLEEVEETQTEVFEDIEDAIEERYREAIQRVEDERHALRQAVRAHRQANLDKISQYKMNCRKVISNMDLLNQMTEIEDGVPITQHQFESLPHARYIMDNPETLCHLPHMTGIPAVSFFTVSLPTYFGELEVSEEPPIN